VVLPLSVFKLRIAAGEGKSLGFDEVLALLKKRLVK
jgi:hypothetical protein